MFLAHLTLYSRWSFFFLQFLGSDFDFHVDFEMECHKEYSSSLKEVLVEETDVQASRYESAEACYPPWHYLWQWKQILVDAWDNYLQFDSVHFQKITEF